MKSDFFREQLKLRGLKVTPQRIAIYEALVKLNNHPTAERVIDSIRTKHPNISIGTVYKVLDTLVENNLLKRVKNDKDNMRYDAVVLHHHHIYCSETDRIENYEDEQLDKLIREYFKKKKIKRFKIQDITLQITGKFINK